MERLSKKRKKERLIYMRQVLRAVDKENKVFVLEKKYFYSKCIKITVYLSQHNPSLLVDCGYARFL